MAKLAYKFNSSFFSVEIKELMDKFNIDIRGKIIKEDMAITNINSIKVKPLFGM